MAQGMRVEYPGVLYHVMTRGNQRPKKAEVIGANKDREPVRAREIICYVGRNRTELSVTALARSLGVDGTCVSRSVAPMERRLRDDKELKKVVDKIIAAVEISKHHTGRLVQ